MPLQAWVAAARTGLKADKFDGNGLTQAATSALARRLAESD